MNPEARAPGPLLSPPYGPAEDAAGPTTPDPTRADLGAAAVEGRRSGEALRNDLIKSKKSCVDHAANFEDESLSSCPCLSTPTPTDTKPAPRALREEKNNNEQRKSTGKEDRWNALFPWPRYLAFGTVKNVSDATYKITWVLSD